MGNQEWLQQQGVTSGTADGASTADKAPAVSTIGMTVLVENCGFYEHSRSQAKVIKVDKKGQFQIEYVGYKNTKGRSLKEVKALSELSADVADAAADWTPQSQEAVEWENDGVWWAGTVEKVNGKTVAIRVTNKNALAKPTPKGNDIKVSIKSKKIRPFRQLN